MSGDFKVGSDMNHDRSFLLNSFPAELRNDVEVVLKKVPLNAKINSIGLFQVKFSNEIVFIPERVYYKEPWQINILTLTPVQKTILDCIFSRHHNGFIREKKLEKIIPICNENLWVMPFIIHLLGEYVIEILQVIESNLYLINKESINSFIKENPDFYRKIESRVASYWNCYYRHQFPNKEDYVGFQILRYINSGENESSRHP